MSCHRGPLGLGRPAASGQSTILYIYATKEGFGDLQGAQSIHSSGGTTMVEGNGIVQPLDLDHNLIVWIQIWRAGLSN